MFLITSKVVEVLASVESVMIPGVHFMHCVRRHVWVLAPSFHLFLDLELNVLFLTTRTPLLLFCPLWPLSLSVCLSLKRRMPHTHSEGPCS